MTYRVWARDWVPVFTSDADGPEGEEECAGHFRRKYEGNVLPDEHRIKGTLSWPATLELRLYTVVAEYRLKSGTEGVVRAMDKARIKTWVAELGSDEDKAMELYGKRKLPTT